MFGGDRNPDPMLGGAGARLGCDRAEKITIGNSQGAIRHREMVKRRPERVDLNTQKNALLGLFGAKDERSAPNRNAKNGGEYRHRLSVP